MRSIARIVVGLLAVCDGACDEASDTASNNEPSPAGPTPVELAEPAMHEGDVLMSTPSAVLPSADDTGAPLCVAIGENRFEVRPDAHSQASGAQFTNGVHGLRIYSLSAHFQSCGLRPRDVLLELNGKPVTDADSVSESFLELANRRGQA